MFPMVAEAAYNFAEESSLIAQNHRMVGVGRDLCWSSSPCLNMWLLHHFSLTVCSQTISLLSSPWVSKGCTWTVTCADTALYLFTTDHVRLPQKRETICQTEEEADAKNMKIKVLVLLSFMLHMSNKSTEVSW